MNAEPMMDAKPESPSRKAMLGIVDDLQKITSKQNKDISKLAHAVAEIQKELNFHMRLALSFDNDPKPEVFADHNL